MLAVCWCLTIKSKYMIVLVVWQDDDGSSVLFSCELGIRIGMGMVWEREQGKEAIPYYRCRTEHNRDVS